MEPKGFIEITCLSRTQRMDSEGCTVFGTCEDPTLVSLTDIARLQFGGIVFKTPFANGECHCTTKETYEELKELIKSATE